MPPAYRERLRIEGFTLALCGAAGAAAVLVVPESRRMPLSTVGQLAAVAVLLEVMGSRSVRRWLRDAVEVEEGGEGSGEPTPLWQLPVITAGLTAAFVLLPRTGLPGSQLAGWDAGLRVAGGCLLVGLWQALRYERIVAAEERSRDGRFFRGPGSRLGRGTVVVFRRGR